MNKKQSQSGQSIMGAITKLAVIIFVLSLLGVAAYRNQAVIKSYVPSLSPACSSPLSYRVDGIDPKFGITDAKFKQAINEAAQIWDKAAGKQLFVYDDKGEMPISLIYDSRQQAIDQLKKLNLSLDSTQASYDQLKKVYLQQKSDYNAAKSVFDSHQQQYNTEKQAYETAVQEANSRGGATPEEYAKLNAEKDRLNAKVAALNSEGGSLNTQVQNLNALVENLNRIGKELNLDVSAYNSTGENLGEFEEGVFTQDVSGKKIVIYEFNNYQSLVRVLAHELGHSLGMEHVNDPNAIMYKLNQSKNQIPTADDIAELKKTCKF